MSQQRSGKLIPILLFLLFVGPLATAFLMYYGSGWRPLDTTNRGELLSPAAPLPESRLQFTRAGDGKSGGLEDTWWLLHLAPDGCDDACANSLVTTRQVRLSLGRKSDRVNRAFIGSDAKTSEHPDLFVASAASARTLLADFGDGATQYVWLIDPLGNRVLRYPLDAPPDDFFRDIKKLLRTSRIG